MARHAQTQSFRRQSAVWQCWGVPIFRAVLVTVRDIIFFSLSCITGNIKTVTMDTTVISEGLKPVFPETASLWDRAIGDVFICFVGFCSSEEPPPGSYHELEKESQFADQKFVGGIQACVIVRYHQSPIGEPRAYAECIPLTDHIEGEYDELLWIPGAFKLPTCGKRTYRATRAYVSTPLAVYSGLCTNVLALVDILLQHAKTIYNSGRKNWNVPKAVRQ